VDVLLWHRFKNIGFDVTKNELDYLYQEFLKIADTKKEVVNEDLQVMMATFSQKTV
jgi:2-isopropylmalate synthase